MPSKLDTNGLVDWYLLAHREWRQRDQGHTQTGWRSSSLGYCLRKQTYARMGIDGYRDFDAQTLRTFSMGDTYHDWIKRIYRNSGALLTEEGRLSLEGRDVKGHYDVLLTGTPGEITEAQRDRWSPEWTEHVEDMRAKLAVYTESFKDDVVIGEIKSISEWGLKARRKEGAQHSHKMQVASYMLMARADPEQLPAMPTSGRVIYIGKDSKSSIFEVEMEDSWVDEVDQIIDQLNEHWTAGTLPPCTCEGWEVGYCDYLLPTSRTIVGKPKSNIVGGTDCCPPELFAKAKEGTQSAV